MAELIISKDEVVGIKKEIEEGSLELIFNALQSDIYSFPIKSFVRETISNGLDSIIEKNVYKAIQGGDSVEKYFRQEQDGALLKDSAYDKDYYDGNYLSLDDKVYVEYQEGSPRDKIIIRDYGVGLGGTRLRGFFKVGYSSKRNFFTARGLFGLGSKSALATGVDYFTITTVYDGYRTSFMVYNRDYENITPETLGGRVDIWKVTMANDQVIDKKIFWEPVNESNSVKIEVEVKKHNKRTYISAVKDQFQYFNGAVTLKQSTEYLDDEIDELNERPEYESEALLIPKYSTYSSPHILVDGISYGLVSWEELELETRRGRIALKVSANEVDITQSRESLKWTDKTKKTILRSIQRAEDEASEYVRANIKIEDKENIFALNNAYNSLSDTVSQTVTNTFSRFLAMHNIKPKYTMCLGDATVPGNKISTILGANLFDFLFYSFDFKKVYTFSEGKKLKLKTEVIREFDSISGSIMIFGKESSLGPKLVTHLLNKFNVSTLVYIRENTTRIKNVISLSKTSKDYNTESIKKYALNLITKYNHLYLDDYEVIYDESDEIDDVVMEDNKINQAMQRKMNKEIMWYEFQFNTWYSAHSLFNRNKHTVKISDLQPEVKHVEVIVVPSQMTKLGKMLVMLEFLRESKNALKIVFVSDNNTKYFMQLGCTHITNYFRTLDEKTGELMIGDKLVELNTAWQFHKLKEKYNNFSYCAEIISELSTINKKKYDSFIINSGNATIKSAMKQSTGDDSAIVEEIFTYLDSLSEFQNVLETKDKDVIASKALELFGTDKIHNIYAYDKDYIDHIDEELGRLSVISPIIRNIGRYETACNPLLTLLIETIHKQKQEN